MTTIQQVLPYSVSAGSEASARTVEGTFTLTRDDATQIVTARLQGSRVAGTGTGALYVTFAAGTIEPEFLPENSQYPTSEGLYWNVEPTGYTSIYVPEVGTPWDSDIRWVTAAPIVEPQPTPTESALKDIQAWVQLAGITFYIGYAHTGARVPYVVGRPLIIDTTGEALDGSAIDTDFQFSLYCCGASVEASFNLALDVMGTLQGKRVRGTTLSTSMGYSGAPIEGHYESQVTVQLNQGAI